MSKSIMYFECYKCERALFEDQDYFLILGKLYCEACKDQILGGEKWRES